MSKVAAFGVVVFTPQGKSKVPPVLVQEMNNKLEQLGLTAEDVITVQVEHDLWHVFYRTK